MPLSPSWPLIILSIFYQIFHQLYSYLIPVDRFSIVSSIHHTSTTHSIQYHPTQPQPHAGMSRHQTLLQALSLTGSPSYSSSLVFLLGRFWLYSRHYGGNRGGGEARPESPGEVGGAAACTASQQEDLGGSPVTPSQQDQCVPWYGSSQSRGSGEEGGSTSSL